MSKQQDIIEMFNKIAKTYDIANRVLSMGIDKTWRRKACNASFKYYGKSKLDKIVDVACGTGDLMIDWDNIAKQNGIEVNEIIGIDPSVGMMEVGKTKIPHGIFIEAGAEKMPLDKNSADIISISYGIRNVVQRKEGLKEFARVLKKGGLLIILEFTRNDNNSILRNGVDFYSNKILPFIASIFSDKEAYEYLPNSIENFYTQDELCDLLEGFEILERRYFNFGQVSLIIAKKIYN